MFGFLRLLDLFCASVALAIINRFFPPVLFLFCVYVLTGFVNVWISVSSQFVLCFGCHSHCKSVLSPGSVFCVVFRCSQVSIVWISESSGLMSCFDGHSHRQSCLPSQCRIKPIIRKTASSHSHRQFSFGHDCAKYIARDCMLHCMVQELEKTLEPTFRMSLSHKHIAHMHQGPGGTPKQNSALLFVFPAMFRLNGATRHSAPTEGRGRT